MELKVYIKDLLINNQGVIIPDFGGFVSEYEPAAFDVNDNKFLPPSKTIRFKSDYTYQDSLLANYISEKQGVELAEAEKIIKDFVKTLKSDLQQKKNIDFPEIGSLQKDAKGKIIFKQAKGVNLLPDSFGLQSVKTNKPITTTHNPVVEQKPKKAKKVNAKLILLVSFFVVLVGLAAISWVVTSGFSDFSIITSNETETKPVVIDEQVVLNTEKNLDSIAKADTLKAIIHESIDDNTDKKDALFYSEPKEPVVEKPQYSTFYIIAGSFKKIENAEEFAKGIRAKGFETEIIESSKNLIRISIFKYSDETEALKKLYKLRQESDLKSVWILKEV